MLTIGYELLTRECVIGSAGNQLCVYFFVQYINCAAINLVCGILNVGCVYSSSVRAVGSLPGQPPYCPLLIVPSSCALCIASRHLHPRMKFRSHSYMCMTLS